MLRIGLIAYLMVVTLAGPAWYCCTLSRLTAWSTSGKIANAEAKPHGCCHRQVPSQNRIDSKNAAERATPAPQESPCPCKEQRSNEMATVPSTSQEAEDYRWLSDELSQVHPLFMPSSWVFPAAVQSNFALSCVSDGAVLTGRQILCAFQVFLC
ncbi:MAG: hypothetical protein K2X38_20430 [Gemmataceae bacterium]|nr:hypothetical protein [Gemmataceae bacterium]